ncbi:MAG: RNA polymerase Rpb6 [Bacteroidota bacterium]|nr:RNA polymerase Rpb6 [Bacteroidota bacterium]
MNFKNVKAERNTITRNTKTLEEKGTGNIFETIVVLSRRSDQLSQDLKKELNSKMEEFVIPNDTLEEVFENREQIEISKFYERLAKPQAIAIKELEEDNIYVRKEEKEESFKA